LRQKGQEIASRERKKERKKGKQPATPDELDCVEGVEPSLDKRNGYQNRCPPETSHTVNADALAWRVLLRLLVLFKLRDVQRFRVQYPRFVRRVILTGLG
jgi:hypothetical protein